MSEKQTAIIRRRASMTRRPWLKISAPLFVAALFFLASTALLRAGTLLDRPVGTSPAAMQFHAATAGPGRATVGDARAVASAGAHQTDTQLRSRRIALPALNRFLQRAVCDARVVVQNTGATPSRFALLLWGEPGECPPDAAPPSHLLASPVVQPGRTFAFEVPGASSGVVYSFSAEDTNGDGTPDADEAIRRFQETIVDAGDFEAWRLEELSLRQTGATRGGEPLGAPIAVVVKRSCRPPDYDVPTDATYTGVSDREWGQPDADGGYAYAVPQVLTSPSSLDPNTRLYIQNAGLECTPVTLSFRPITTTETCPAPITTTIPALPPATSAVIDTRDVVGAGFQGAAWIQASQPLAILAEHQSPVAQISSMAQPASTAWTRGYAFPASRWLTDLWFMNTDVTTDARVRLSFLDVTGTLVTSTTLQVCPRGGERLALKDYEDLPFDYHGSVRIEATAPVVAVADRLRCADPLCMGLVSATGTEVPPIALQPSSNTALAVPLLVRSGRYSAVDSELIVQNENPAPGSTHVAVDFYPPAGPPATCHFELRPEQSITLRLREYRVRGPGTMSAIVRSTGSTQAGGPMLSAVAQAWAMWFGGDVSGDEATAYTAPAVATDYRPPADAFDCLAPYLSVAPQRITASAVFGQAGIVTRTLTITNANYLGPELAWEAQRDAPWVTLQPVTGTTPATVTVRLDLTGLPVGHHTAHITVTGITTDTRRSPQTIPIEAVVRQEAYLPLISKNH